MGVKISELVEKTTANSSDVIPIVDTGTKKITKANLLKEVTNSIETINTKLTNLGNYSTEEKVIGIWIDGKPVYRKVYSQSNIANINLTDLNYDYIHIVNSTLTVSDYRRNPYYTSSTDYFRVLINNGKKLIAESSAVSSSISNWTTILEYTKTTD